jgi:hypothetical protein
VTVDCVSAAIEVETGSVSMQDKEIFNACCCKTFHMEVYGL